MNRLSESIIRDILIEEMSLDPENIWIRDQNKEIPNNDELYLIVGMVDSQVMSNRSDQEFVTVDGAEAMKQTSRVQMRENIQIDIVSASKSAIQRRWEVVAAMQSFKSLREQEDNYFKIFRVPNSFVNTSDAEGPQRLNRFSITLACHVWYSKEKIITETGDFYDTFDTRVDDKDTIGEENGLIEFTIDENTTI